MTMYLKGTDLEHEDIEIFCSLNMWKLDFEVASRYKHLKMFPRYLSKCSNFSACNFEKYVKGFWHALRKSLGMEMY